MKLLSSPLKQKPCACCACDAVGGCRARLRYAMQMLSARVAFLRLPTGLRVGAAPRIVGYPTRCAAAGPDRLPPPDVQKLAKLAQIAVTEEEVCSNMH